MTERSRQHWKPSSQQQAARYRTHHDAQQKPTPSICSNNGNGGTFECEEGLTYIIENAFEHRPRSLPSKGSISSSGLMSEVKKNDDDVMADNTCSGFTFDETLATISSRSKKGKVKWNRFSSSVKELNETFQHFPYVNVTSLHLDTRNKLRLAVMSSVLFLFFVTLNQHYRTQQHSDHNSTPQLKGALHSNQYKSISGRFVEVDSGSWEKSESGSLLTEKLLDEVRSSIRNAAYYDSSTSPMNSTIGVQGADYQTDTKIFLMPPTEPLGGKSETVQETKDIHQPSTSAVDSEAAASSSSSSFVESLNGYKDTWEPHEESDSPVFLHIPKAGGSTIKDLIGTCHRKILASESGIAEGHGVEDTIALVGIGGNPIKGQEPSVFVNVDTTTVEGLKRAKRLGLAQSGLADTIVTTYVHELHELFDKQHRGRLFAMFRHPVDRAVSLFHYLKYADWEPTYTPSLAKMSIEDYAKSGMAENNWLTRTLAHRSDEAVLTDDDLQKAIDIIRRKILVGLLSEKEESMERIEKFFGWKYRVNPKNQEICRARLLGAGINTNKENTSEKLTPGTTAYDLLANENLFDLKLYDMVTTLFVEQSSYFSAVPDGYRLKNATCCKCQATC